jgi:hypothetical protein
MPCLSTFERQREAQGGFQAELDKGGYFLLQGIVSVKI